MNLLLSGSRKGQATAGGKERRGEERQGVRGLLFTQEKKKTLDGYISLISCYSNQSLDFQVPGLWQSSFFFFFLQIVFFFLFNRKQRE